MHLILDTEILIQHPHLLSLGGKKVKFILPQVVVEELREVRFGKDFVELIEAAAQTKRLEILPRPVPQKLTHTVSRMNPGDESVIQTALHYLKTKKDAILVTEDNKLKSVAEKYGILTADGAHMLKRLESSAAEGVSLTATVRRAADAIARQTRRYFLQGLVIGVVTSSIVILTWQFREEIVRLIPRYGMLPIALVVGVALFIFRSRQRLDYGLVEVAIGIFATYYSQKADLSNPDSIVRVLAGLYIVVRGLDSIGKGIEGTRYEGAWRRFFKGNSDTP
ncbi:MAG: PIN domain-containing protein [Turneriella sp.]